MHHLMRAGMAAHDCSALAGLRLKAHSHGRCCPAAPADSALPQSPRESRDPHSAWRQLTESSAVYVRVTGTVNVEQYEKVRACTVACAA